MRIGIAWVVVAAAVVAALGARLPAQTAPVHLNPVIAKLARGRDRVRPDQPGRPVAGQRPGDRARAGGLRLRRHGAQPARLRRAEPVPARHDRQGGDPQEGQPAAQRRADGALSARGRPVGLGGEAGARHRPDGRDLQRRGLDRAGGGGGALDALSEAQGRAAPGARRAARLRARPTRCGRGA